MERYKGKAVCGGVAFGRIKVLKKSAGPIKPKRIEDTKKEIIRLKKAREIAKKQLDILYEKAYKEVGLEGASLFEVHQMMLEDEDYVDAIETMIQSENVNAEYAVSVIGDTFADKFEAMNDDYMKARALDVRDISERIQGVLRGEKKEIELNDNAIILADDLSPSETVQLDKEKILAFVTVHGSVNSHTSILARMMNIPALIGVPICLETIGNEGLAIVDGENEEIILNPNAEQIVYVEKQMARQKEKRDSMEKLKNQKTVTKSGRRINLYANIGNVSDISCVLENDAEGVGLFRSEFLYLGREDFPTEEEQFTAYKQVLQAMKGKRVIIRTLDIGADKQADYFHFDREENPAMGYRAIRICLTEPEIFKTQLRALLRASYYGNLAIMYPMITSEEEVNQIQSIVEELIRELDEKKIPFKKPDQGIMIETPAAVMISRELAKMVDFFSIGTNDLTQYTLAIDRQNEKLDAFYLPHHRGILRMIKMVVDNAHKEGKWVGICGELGADTELTAYFAELGVDELSVAPSMILPIRKIIRELE